MRFFSILILAIVLVVAAVANGLFTDDILTYKLPGNMEKDQPELQTLVYQHLLKKYEGAQKSPLALLLQMAALPHSYSIRPDALNHIDDNDINDDNHDDNDDDSDDEHAQPFSDRLTKRSDDEAERLREALQKLQKLHFQRMRRESGSDLRRQIKSESRRQRMDQLLKLHFQRMRRTQPDHNADDRMRQMQKLHFQRMK